MREGELLHQRARLLVVDRIGRVVVRHEHQVLPVAVVAVAELRRLGRLRHFDGLAKQRADDVDHRVVGRLARLRIALRGVADDAERRFVRDDVDRLDLVGILENLRVLTDEREDALQRARRLVLVEAELEVHAHDREIAARVREDEVEWAVAVRLLELAEHALRIAENVARPEESAHRAHHGKNGHFRRNRGRCALRVTQLLTRANRAPRDVVGNSHTDRALDLLGGCAHHRAVGRGARDRAVNDVIDLVGLEREDFGEAAADLVDANHAAQRVRAVTPLLLRCGNGDGVEVVVAELARGVAELRVETEVGAVRVPLAHGVRVRDDRLLSGNLCGRTEHGHALRVRVLRRLSAEDDGRVRIERDRADAAEHRVGVEHRGALKHRRVGRADLPRHEVDRELPDTEGLVRVARKDGLVLQNCCVGGDRHGSNALCTAK